MAEKLSEARLKEMDERLSSATSGPWAAKNDEIGLIEQIPDKRTKTGYREKFHPFLLRNDIFPFQPIKGNLAFIIHAPQDITDLLAEVRRLRGEKKAKK